MRQPFDIIYVQDPPQELPFLSSGFYNLWFDVGRELTEDDHPLADARASSPNLRNKTRVAYFVHRSIPTTDWRVTTDDDHNTGLVATLQLSTPSGKIILRNVYNRFKSVDIDELLETCTGAAHIVLGDFNLHHPSWCGNGQSYTVENDAQKLATAMKAAHMKLLTTPGAITYSRSTRVDQHSSTIDLVFAGSAIAIRDPEWKVLDVDEFESDHRVTQTTVDIQSACVTKNRRNWKKNNKSLAEAATREAFKSLDQTPLYTVSEIDEYAAKMIKVINKVSLIMYS